MSALKSSDVLLAEVSACLEKRIGLHFPATRWRDLERGLASAAAELGLPDSLACARWLLSESPTRNQIELLASHLTVGETYFFRDGGAFAALKNRVLPQLIEQRRAAGRQLRLWSAGCCTGEEPYSLAILLRELIPRPDEWSITILATDINPKFLQKARAGVYREWSFRSTPEWVVKRYFSKRDDDCYEISAAVKEMVRFAHLNLVEDPYPSPSNGAAGMDVILCRNVLMYFTVDRTKAVVERMARCLSDGGCLLVSAVEGFHLLQTSLTPVKFGGVTACWKAAPTQPSERTISPAARLQPEAVPSWPDNAARGGALAAVGRMETARPRRERPKPGERSPEKRDASASPGRALANQGRLEEALNWCDQALAGDKLNPSLHYLRAEILLELGRTRDAGEALRRVLFLEPRFALAHVGLGDIARRLGRKEEARKHFDNARRLLEDLDPEETLPEADGMTAGRLCEIVSSMIDAH